VRYVVRVGEEQVEVRLDADGVHVDGETVHAHLEEVGSTPLRLLRIGERVHRVLVRRGDGRGRYTLWLGSFRYDVEALDERTRVIRELAGASASASGPAPLIAPMPGLIVRVHVQAGECVQAGQPLVSMEAMKMENELRAGAPGRVRAVHAVPGSAVEKGALLVEMEEA
jgi:acetyl/propionyl-CoA carboxylase alpha subunit